MGVSIPQIITSDRASGAKHIDGSLTFDSERHTWLGRVHNNQGTRIWTWSGWCKKGSVGAYQQLFTGLNSGTNQSGIIFMNDDSLRIYSQGGLAFEVKTHARHRDPNGWLHVCVAVDTTETTSSNRVKLWVNGERITYLVTATYPGYCNDTYINQAIWHYIGANQPASNTFNGQICDAYFIDNQALTASEFGFKDPLTDSWRPKNLSVRPTEVNNGTTWSSHVTSSTGSFHSGGPAIKLFDGSLNTAVDADTNNGVITFTPPSIISYKESLQVYHHASNVNFVITHEDNSTTTYSRSGVSGTTWLTIARGPGTIKSISCTPTNNNYANWRCIRVDGIVMVDGSTTNSKGEWWGTNGFYLPLDGKTLAGRDQSGGPDGHGVTWSEDGDWIFSSGINSGNEPAKAFDGSESTFAANVYTNNTNGNYIEYTFPRAVTINTKLEINLWMADTNETDHQQFYTINNEAEITMDRANPSQPGNHYVTLKASGGADWTGSLTKLKLRVTRTGNNNTNNNLYAIRVDGKVLQDPNNYSTQKGTGDANGLSPAVTIDEATGGLPILNTINAGNIATSGTRLDYSPHTPQWLRDSGAIKFDGDVDYLSVPHSSNYNLGNGNFTLEFWLHPTQPFSHNDNGFISIGENAGTKRILQISGHVATTNGINLAASSNGSAWDMFNMANIGTATMYKWQHLAVVRNGTALTTYKDGVQIHTTNIGTTSFFSNGDYTIQIGSYLNSGSAISHGYEGLISNVRLVVGTAVYTSAFTPPTEPLTAITNTKLLCCQSNSSATAATTIGAGTIGVVGDVGAVASEAAGCCKLALPLAGSHKDLSYRINPSTSEHTVTNSGANTDYYASTSDNFYSKSYYMENNDYLSIPSSSDWYLGSNDWTIEAWVDCSSTTDMAIVNQSNGGAGSNSSIIMYSGSGQPQMYTTEDTGWDNNVLNTQRVSGSGWHHWAAVRHGNNLTMYVDGIRGGQHTNMYNKSIPNSSRSLFIGCQEAGNYHLTGFIQDVRWYNGVAKYTKDFTVPSLRPGIKKDSPSGIANKQELTRSLSNYGSVNLQGNGSNYIKVNDHADLEMGNSAWTLECWIYPHGSGGSSYAQIYSKGVDFQIYWMENTQGLSLYAGSDGSNYNIIQDADITNGAGLFVNNKWNHVSISRSGNNVYVHHDGNYIRSVGFSGTVYNNNHFAAIGVYGPSSSSYNIKGFVSNFRLVVGTALHTTDNFTPSRKPLTPIANTKLLCCQSTTDVTASAVAPSTITKVGNASPSTNNPFEDDVDTVRGKSAAIYPTLNPRERNVGGNELKRGNLRFYNTSNDKQHAATMMLPRYGKYYWECYIEKLNSAKYLGIGVMHETCTRISSAVATVQGRWYVCNGNKGGPSSAAWAYACDRGDHIGIAVDMDNGKIYASINGTWQEGGDPAKGLNPMYSDLRTAYPNIDWYPCVTNWQADNAGVMNFGQTPFRFTPPEGFVPLNSSTIIKEDKPVIVRATDYYMTAYYTGNGDASGGKQLSTSFKPDFIWNKNATTAYHNRLWDSVRGWSNAIYSNNAEDENNWTDYGYPIEVTDTHVKMGQGTNSGNLVNINGSMYAQWMWKAGGGSGAGGEFWKDDIQYGSAASVGLSGGSITPTAASIGTKQGFSIIKYQGNGTSGATIPHGLSEAPTFIIAKSLNHSGSPSVGWGVFHVGGSYTGSMLYLMQGTSTSGDTNVFTTTTQTNNHFTIGDWVGINESGKNYIAYCWHDVPGFQKFGRYQGNGSNDGPYVDLGFKPAMVCWKATNGNNWGQLDTARDIVNPLKHRLHWNSTSTTNSGAGDVIEFMANGFKCISNDGLENGNTTMLYMAWADSPNATPYGGSSIGR